MTIESIFEHSTIDFPYLDLRIERGSHEEVVLRVEVDLRDCFAMCVIILDQSFAAKVIKLYFFVSRTTCQACAV